MNLLSSNDLGFKVIRHIQTVSIFLLHFVLPRVIKQMSNDTFMHQKSILPKNEMENVIRKMS